MRTASTVAFCLENWIDRANRKPYFVLVIDISPEMSWALAKENSVSSRDGPVTGTPGSLEEIMPVNIVNTEQFAELRQSYGYYVDKTGLLLQFLKDPIEPYVIMWAQFS